MHDTYISTKNKNSKDELLGYLDEIAKFHFNNFHKDEISVRLGVERIKYFYKSIIMDENCKVDLKVKNSKIIFIIVFLKNYTQFMKKQKSTNLLSIVKNLIMNKITLRDLYDSLIFGKNVKKFIPEMYINNGLGSAIFNQSFKKDFVEVKNFFSIYKENVNSVDGCWGSCRVGNKSARKLLEYFGGEIAGTANGVHFIKLIRKSKYKAL